MHPVSRYIFVGARCIAPVAPRNSPLPENRPVHTVNLPNGERVNIVGVRIDKDLRLM